MWKTRLHPECENELKELNRTNPKLVSKVVYDFRLLQQFGLDLMEEERVKKLTKTIYELRTKQGSNINRVLFGVRKGKLFVLTRSFVKKTQRTPKSEIELAEQRLKEWKGND